MLWHISEFVSILRLYNIPWYVYSTFGSSIHRPIDIWVAATVAVVTNAAMNRAVQISLHDPAVDSFGYRPRRGIAGSYDSSSFNFLRTLILFSIAVAPFCNHTN